MGTHFLEEMIFELGLQGVGGAPSMSKLTWQTHLGSHIFTEGDQPGSWSSFL